MSQKKLKSRPRSTTTVGLCLTAYKFVCESLKSILKGLVIITLYLLKAMLK